MSAELDRRRDATKKTINRFEGKAFDWSANATCAHLLRFHLRNMGHKAPTIPRFRSALTAKRTLSSLGFDSMEAVLDSLVLRLPGAAYTTLGDVVVKEGDGLDAVLICAGPRRYFGWFEGQDAPVSAEVDPAYLKGCWRV